MSQAAPIQKPTTTTSNHDKGWRVGKGLVTNGHSGQIVIYKLVRIVCNSNLLKSNTFRYSKFGVSVAVAADDPSFTGT